MLEGMLKRKNIRIVNGARDWKHAVEIGVAPLLEDGSVTYDYVNAIIDLTEREGAYYVIMPEVALLHARPENGVIRGQMAVTLLKNPVLFKNKSIPTKLLIAFSTLDSNSHLETLQQLGTVLSNQETVKKILEVADVQVIWEALTKPCLPSAF